MTTVSNTAVGQFAALPLALGGQGYPTASFLTLSSGTFTANQTSSVTVADAGVTANSALIFTLGTVGGTVGNSGPVVKTITPGTGFTVTALASDTSIYNYLRIG